MKDLAHTLGVLYRDMKHISAMHNRTNLDNKKRLYDNYTNAKIRRQNQIYSAIRTRHK